MRQEHMNFDTYKHVKSFEKAGFRTDQAEALVSVISTSRDFDISRLATKEQLFNLEEKLTAQISALDTKLTERISNLDEKLTERISKLDEKLTERISNLDEKLTERISNVEEKLTVQIYSLDKKLTEQISASQAQVIAIIKESSLSNIRWQIGIMVPLIVAFIGLAYKLFPK